MTNTTSTRVQPLHQRFAKHCDPTPPSTGTPTPRILCVDDDPDIQTALELRMRPYDVELDHAFYGMQGIVEAVKKHPDLILMDLAMPNGNGEYLLECVKKNRETAHIPIIVLTGMRNPALKRQLLSAGADVFLQKPIQFDELLHELGRFIDLQKSESEWDCHA